ncbi:unnamed protein product [Calypogeia fissa]
MASGKILRPLVLVALALVAGVLIQGASADSSFVRRRLAGHDPTRLGEGKGGALAYCMIPWESASICSPTPTTANPAAPSASQERNAPEASAARLRNLREAALTRAGTSMDMQVRNYNRLLSRRRIEVRGCLDEAVKGGGISNGQ